jgi:hypothetical protein
MGTGSFIGLLPHMDPPHFPFGPEWSDGTEQ